MRTGNWFEDTSDRSVTFYGRETQSDDLSSFLDWNTSSRVSRTLWIVKQRAYHKENFGEDSEESRRFETAGWPLWFVSG